MISPIKKIIDSIIDWSDGNDEKFEFIVEIVELIEEEGRTYSTPDGEYSQNESTINQSEYRITLRTNEKEFYSGEFNYIIKSILTNATHTTNNDTRRGCVINSLLDKNKFKNERNKIIEEVDSTFRTYKKLDRSTRKKLCRAGFSLKDGNNYYRLFFNNDERFVISFSCTPSAKNAGKNIISDIKRKFF